MSKPMQHMTMAPSGFEPHTLRSASARNLDFDNKSLSRITKL